MIDSGGDGPGIPTASLLDILRNDPYIADEAKLKRGVRKDLALYIRSMNLSIRDLEEEFDFGVYAVRAIRDSDSFQGFVDGLHGRKIDSSERNEIDYKLGYDKGRKRYSK